jgi:hypothetical protein
VLSAFQSRALRQYTDSASPAPLSIKSEPRCGYLPCSGRTVPATVLFGSSIVRASSGMISLHPPHMNTRRTRTNLPGRRETRPQLVHNTVTLLTGIFLFLKDAQRWTDTQTTLFEDAPDRSSPEV